jgi:hypothetical protein
MTILKKKIVQIENESSSNECSSAILILLRPVISNELETSLT